MFQQRRTAPAVSAYESQAARWKQGFSAPGQPGHPQHQQQQQTGSARHSDLEGVLIGELCSSIGSSSFPPRDVLQKLVRYLPSLDHSYVCKLLDDKLQHRLWQVQGKALSVLDAVLKTPHAEPYKLHYHTRIALLHELGHSRKDIVKNRAEKVLAVISAFVPPPAAAPAPHEQPSHEHQHYAQAYHEPASHPNDYHHVHYQQQQQQTQEIDLLQGFDDPDEHDDEAAAMAPESAAQSAFGFISAPAAAAAAPVAGPAPTAPPMTESSFGFLNAPAVAPAPAPTAAHSATDAAPAVHLSSTSPPPHDRPLTIKDLSTSMHQQPRMQQQHYTNTAAADVPTASAFAFLAGGAAPAVPPAQPGFVAPPGLPRPVDMWDVLPVPTPTVGLALSASESASAPPTADDDDEEEKTHDPIHDAFEGLDASTNSDIDALDHTHVSLATPYPSREPIMQTREPLREVILDIELPPGPMGVVLDRTITDMAVIERFIPLPSGERGYLEMHPAICPGCALLSVNSVSVEDKGLDEVGPVLAAFAQVPKVLRFKKLMNNGRTANPSTLLMPYIPPPSEEEEAAKRESSEHMTRLTEFSASLDDVESKLDDLERREQLHLPVVDKKNQLAQLHGTVEKIQTQGIDAVILGPNPPPNFDEVKKFRSSLVRRADALTKRIQSAAEPAVVVAPAVSPAHEFAAAVAPVAAAVAETPAIASPVSAFSFVAGAPAVVPPSMAPLSLPPVAEAPVSSFHFLNPSTPPMQPPPAPGTSSFAFMEESSEPPASSFAFLQKPSMPAPATATPASVASVFAGLSVKDEPQSVHAASTVSAGPLTLSALGMASSMASVSTLAASGPSNYLPTPTPTPMSSFVHNAHGDTSSTNSSAFGFLSALEDTGVSSAPTAMSSQSAFGFLRSSGGGSSSTSLNSSTSSATSETPPAPASASAFAFISS